MKCALTVKYHPEAQGAPPEDVIRRFWKGKDYVPDAVRDLFRKYRGDLVPFDVVCKILNEEITSWQKVRTVSGNEVWFGKGGTYGVGVFPARNGNGLDISPFSYDRVFHADITDEGEIEVDTV